MSPPNAEIVAAFLDKLLGGDLEGALEHVAQDVVIDEADSLPYGGEHRGREGLTALLTEIMGPLDVEVRDRRLLDAGDVVAVRMDVTLMARASGASVAMPVVELYSVVDGLITRSDVFYKDTKALVDLMHTAAVSP